MSPELICRSCHSRCWSLTVSQPAVQALNHRTQATSQALATIQQAQIIIQLTRKQNVNNNTCHQQAAPLRIHTLRLRRPLILLPLARCPLTQAHAATSQQQQVEVH